MPANGFSLRQLIGRRVENVDQASEQNARQMAESATGLNELARSLGAAIHRFKV